MKPKLLAGLLALMTLFAGVTALAAETNKVETDLRNLVMQIQGKLDKGQRTEAELADDIKEFDALLAKHKDDKPDDVTRILIMKAKLFLQVLNAPEKGIEVFQQLKRDFPQTEAGKNADDSIENIRQQMEEQKKAEEAKKIQQALQPGTKFPEFTETDIANQPLALANYRRKVVLLDFWATWCGPCMFELPNVLQVYEKYHPKGLEIIGISLDEDKAKVLSLTKEKNMTWQQFFDGKRWANKLAVKYGIMSIPTTFLIDGEGKIIGRDFRGPDLEEAVGKALTPAAK